MINTTSKAIMVAIALSMTLLGCDDAGQWSVWRDNCKIVSRDFEDRKQE